MVAKARAKVCSMLSFCCFFSVFVILDMHANAFRMKLHQQHTTGSTVRKWFALMFVCIKLMFEYFFSLLLLVHAILFETFLLDVLNFSILFSVRPLCWMAGALATGCYLTFISSLLFYTCLFSLILFGRWLGFEQCSSCVRVLCPEY